MTAIDELLARRPEVVNLGPREFAAALTEQDVSVVQVEWRPPPQLDEDVAALLEELG